MSVGEVPKMKSDNSIARRLLVTGGAGFSWFVHSGATLTHLIVVVVDALTMQESRQSSGFVRTGFRFVQEIFDRSLIDQLLQRRH